MRPNIGDVPTVAWPFDVIGLKTLRDTVNRIIAAINGDLLSGFRPEDIISAGFSAANTDTVIPHQNKRTPRGVIVLAVDTDGAVVRADAAKWTSAYVVMRSSVAPATALILVV